MLEAVRAEEARAENPRAEEARAAERMLEAVRAEEAGAEEARAMRAEEARAETAQAQVVTKRCMPTNRLSHMRPLMHSTSCLCRTSWACSFETCSTHHTRTRVAPAGRMARPKPHHKSRTGRCVSNSRLAPAGCVELAFLRFAPGMACQCLQLPHQSQTEHSIEFQRQSRH